MQLLPRCHVSGVPGCVLVLAGVMWHRHFGEPKAAVLGSFVAAAMGSFSYLLAKCECERRRVRT